MYVILVYLCLLIAPAEHDFHVSVSDIQLGQEENQIEVAVRIFYDDLELALKHNIQKEDLIEEDVNSLIHDYLTERFQVRIDDQLQSFVLTDIIASSPAVYCILRFDNINTAQMKTIAVKNNILTEIYTDQLNMINLNIGEKPRNKALDGKNTSVLFKLKT